MHNGQAETKEIDNYNIKKDLELFRKSNINNPILWDKYRVETVWMMVIFLISHLSDKQAILEFHVFKTNDIIDSILSINQIQSMISNQKNYLRLSASKLLFHPDL